MKAVLLDTDACIEVIRGNSAPIEQVPEAEFLISAVSRYEILSGLRGRKGTRIEARALEFLEAIETRAVDSKVADQAAKIRIFLQDQGTLIGAYDLLIAGHALSLRSPIVTGNIKEFSRVPSLTVINWREER